MSCYDGPRADERQDAIVRRHIVQPAIVALTPISVVVAVWYPNRFTACGVGLVALANAALAVLAEWDAREWYRLYRAWSRCARYWTP